MAVRPLNSIAGFSTGDPAVTIVQANGDITTINFSANGLSNLGPVSNLTLTGGSNGQFVQTDGTGNLTFATVNVSNINNGTSNVSIDSANGDVTVGVNGTANVTVFTSTGANVANLTVAGVSNLGSNANVKITGGNSGQVLKTDGGGNLSWDDIGNVVGNSAAPMPYYIAANTSFIVNEFKQGLYSQPIEIDGEMVIDGMLIEISDTVQSSDNQILFDQNGVPTGNTGFTFQYWDGNLNVPGNIIPTGSIIPTADDTYDLGTSNNRWRNGYFGGNTIYLGNATIGVDSNGYVVITNQLGGTFTVEGTTASGTNEIENGNSNVYVYANSNIAMSVNGIANVLLVTATGATVTGNVDVTGIKTDNIYYANGTAWNFGQDPGGTDTQIQYNSNGNFGASSKFTFNSVTNNLAVTGNIVLSSGVYYGNAAGLTNIPGANISGNITGNISNANYAAFAGAVVNSSQPNITSVGTLTSLNVSGDGVIGGNLVVNGNLIYVNVEELSIEDPIINLNTGPNGAPPAANSGKDVGSALNYYDTSARIAFMGWDTSNAEFAFGSRVSISDEIVTFTNYGNARAHTYFGNANGGTGTFSGNISAGNASLGNVVSANYLVSSQGCVAIGTGFIAVSAGTGGIFNSSVNDINFGLSANVVIGSTTGNVTARGNLIANNISTTGNISANLITGTLTTAAQANITTVGTLGNLTVAGTANTNNLDSNIATTNSIVSKRSIVPVSTLTVIDSFAANTYRTAKYVVSSKNDDGYESLEVLLIHNDINSYITVYGAINDGGGNTVTMSTGITSGNVELRATGLAANTVVKIIGTYIPD